MTEPARSTNRLHLVIGAAAVMALRAVMSISSAWPQQVADESGYLAIARLLAGGGDTNLGASAPYMPLYSVMVSPGFWLGLGPTGQYRVAIAVNVVLAGLTFWALHALLSRITTASATVRVTAAALAVSLPAVVLSGRLVWTDAAAPLMLVLVLLTGVRFIAEPTTFRTLSFALAPMAGYATHARFLPLAGVATATLVVAAVRRHVKVGPAIGFLAVQAVSYVVIQRSLHHLIDRLNMSRRSSDDLVGGFDVSGFSWGLLGQLWQATVSTTGLVVVGALALVVAATVQGLRTVRPSDQSDEWPAGLALTRDPAVLAFTLIVLAAGFGTSVVFMVNRPRLDHLIYGRYNDMLLVPLVAIGLTVILSGVGRHRQRILLAAGSTALLITLVGGWLLWNHRIADSTADYVATTILGLLTFHDSPLLHLVGISVAGAVLQVMVLGAALLAPRAGSAGMSPNPRVASTVRVAIVGVVVVLIGVGLVRADRGLELYEHHDPSEATTIAAVVPDGEILTCAVTARCPLLEFYRFQHYLPDHDFSLIWDDSWQGTATFLLTDAQPEGTIAHDLRAQGYRPIWHADLSAVAVWELAAAGVGGAETDPGPG